MYGALSPAGARQSAIDNRPRGKCVIAPLVKRALLFSNGHDDGGKDGEKRNRFFT